MSIGAVLLRLRQKYGRGFRVAYARDYVRPRILNTAPVTDTSDSRCEIHVLTSAQDWINLIWTLKSFYFISRRRYALCVHEDGSVPPEGLEAIRKHFPAARILLRADADRQARDFLRGYPRCEAFRQSNALALKLFDFKMSLRSPRMLLFDSDLLFFREPAVFLNRAEDPAYLRNTFNRDVETSYSLDWMIVKERLGFDVTEEINSGFGVVHPDSMRLDWIEECLGLDGILDGHPWRIEQTLFALLSSRYGVELLPQDYQVYLTPGLGDRPFRHYVGAVRHLMYSEGMLRLVKQGLLDMKPSPLTTDQTTVGMTTALSQRSSV